MGFDINEEITTKLHYKDVSLISVALNMYLESAGKAVDSEVSQRATRLVNRLGNELYDCPQTEPNGH